MMLEIVEDKVQKKQTLAALAVYAQVIINAENTIKDFLLANPQDIQPLHYPVLKQQIELLEKLENSSRVTRTGLEAFFKKEDSDKKPVVKPVEDTNNAKK